MNINVVYDCCIRILFDQGEKKSSHILHRSKLKCCELTDYRVEIIYDPKNCVYYNSSNIFTDLSENLEEKKME